MVVHCVGVFVRRAAVGRGQFMEIVPIVKEDTAVRGKEICGGEGCRVCGW